MPNLKSLSSRLVALLVIPLIVLLVLAGLHVRSASDRVARSRAVEKHVELSLAAALAARQLSLDADIPAGLRADAEDPTDRFFDLHQVLDGPDGPTIAGQMSAQLSLTRAVRAMAQEQALVAEVFATGVIDPSVYRRAFESAASQEVWLSQFADTAPPDALERFESAVAGPTATTVDQLRQDALAGGPGGQPEGTAAAWSAAMNRRLDLLDGIAQDTASTVLDLAADQTAAATSRRSAAGVMFLGLLVLAGSVLTGLHRLVLAPLRRLATEAEASPPDEHPAPPDGSASTEPVTADAVYLNFGRRTQNLVTQQLSHIDDLEARTENPDTLADLFLLDHLTTRLRRNAESLVVVAGADTPRPWSRPVSVVNVVRAALAETSDYSRVELAPMPAALVVGAVANDVSHLLAELIDNALDFSPPESRVRVAGQAEADGRYLVAVSDSGRGMSPRQLDEANERIAHPSTSGVAPGSFGLFVVGRLAKRHGISIRLRSAGIRGLVAEVLLPQATLAEEQPLRHQAPAATFSLTTLDEPPGCIVTP